jgi:hypothetical protein
MHVTSEFQTQPGLRRVLEALKITTAEWKATKDPVMPSHASAEPDGCNIVFLSDLRKRRDHGDDPTDPPPATAAARPYELTLVQAVAAPVACAA